MCKGFRMSLDLVLKQWDNLPRESYMKNMLIGFVAVMTILTGCDTNTTVTPTVTPTVEVSPTPTDSFKEVEWPVGTKGVVRGISAALPKYAVLDFIPPSIGESNASDIVIETQRLVKMPGVDMMVGYQMAGISVINPPLVDDVLECREGIEVVEYETPTSTHYDGDDVVIVEGERYVTNVVNYCMDGFTLSEIAIWLTSFTKEIEYVDVPSVKVITGFYDLGREYAFIKYNDSQDWLLLNKMEGKTYKVFKPSRPFINFEELVFDRFIYEHHGVVSLHKTNAVDSFGKGSTNILYRDVLTIDRFVLKQNGGYYSLEEVKYQWLTENELIVHTPINWGANVTFYGKYLERKFDDIRKCEMKPVVGARFAERVCSDNYVLTGLLKNWIAHKGATSLSIVENNLVFNGGLTHYPTFPGFGGDYYSFEEWPWETAVSYDVTETLADTRNVFGNLVEIEYIANTTKHSSGYDYYEFDGNSVIIRDVLSRVGVTIAIPNGFRIADRDILTHNGVRQLTQTVFVYTLENIQGEMFNMFIDVVDHSMKIEGIMPDDILVPVQ